MNVCRTRHRSSIPWPFEIFIVQKTKPAPLSRTRVASDLEEVCESRGRGREGVEVGAGVQACERCPGRWAFQPHFSLWREAATMSTFDGPAENGYICGCFVFFLI